MVTERVITLPTEPTEGEIVKSHPLFSFINIGQRGRIQSPDPGVSHATKRTAACVSDVGDTFMAV